LESIASHRKSLIPCREEPILISETIHLYLFFVKRLVFEEPTKQNSTDTNLASSSELNMKMPPAAPNPSGARGQLGHAWPSGPSHRK